MDENEKETKVILYVLVVGFHHKKGCQLEYVYPSFPIESLPSQSNPHEAVSRSEEGSEPELHLPELWKHLPSLGLPDGAHRYESDTVYFHLPSLDDAMRTVFGISCYRQIDADKLIRKDCDVTRETVQKSVVVVSRLPLFGIIEAKLALITHAYFEERDFSKVQLLEDTYNQLNESTSEKLLDESQIFVGLSVRDLVVRFKHRLIVLFKLFLLEKKILVFSSPVKLLSSSILSLVSLFPEMLEHGLSQCTYHSPARSEDNQLLAAVPDDQPQLSFVSEMDLLQEINSALTMTDEPDKTIDFSKSHLTLSSNDEEVEGDTTIAKNGPSTMTPSNSEDVIQQHPTFPVKPSLKKKDDYGFPLEVFTKGYVCHPYLSLAFYDDIINDASIPGFLVGATNMLFLHHHKKFAHALVDVVEGKVEIYDADLKRQLEPTMEDLRFIDYVVRMVANDPSRSDVFHGTGWEGGEEWIRSQCRTYLMAMLGTASHCSALDKNQKLALDAYNYSFISAWRKTKNFRIWNENLPIKLDEFATGHPYSGEFSVNDLKTKASSLITPERAKKITAVADAVNQTGKVVAQTTKTWGDAVTSWVAGMTKKN